MALQQKKPDAVKFMGTQVKPAMANLLNVDEWTPTIRRASAATAATRRSAAGAAAPAPAAARQRRAAKPAGGGW